MLAGLWYSVNWGLVLAGLIAGVAASVLGGRPSLVWRGVSLSAIGLYLGICAAILLEAIRLGHGLAAAGLQLVVGLAILGVSIGRLHLIGIAIYSAGGAASALMRAVSDDPLSAQDPSFVVLDIAAAGFLIILGRFVAAEWRRLTAAMCFVQAKDGGNASRPARGNIAA
ncbi:hypothetical protein [Ferrovibrio sp.]|uniref:hypothetical protein n=1 Tax=Ferrovibrio sp. TaxID=1917215 RepID=UPI0026212F18|nr:hypothetical protein [Ferrovibrio sp.]